MAVFPGVTNIAVLPTFVVVDAEGRVAKVATGAPSAAKLESWLSEVGGCPSLGWDHGLSPLGKNPPWRQYSTSERGKSR